MLHGSPEQLLVLLQRVGKVPDGVQAALLQVQVLPVVSATEPAATSPQVAPVSLLPDEALLHGFPSMPSAAVQPFWSMQPVGLVSPFDTQPLAVRQLQLLPVLGGER